MGWIEAPGMADHADEAGFLLHLALTASASSQLSARGISTWTCLPASMHWIACSACIWVGVAQDRGIDARLGQRFGEIGRRVRDAVFVGDASLVGSSLRPTSGNDFNAVDVLDAVEMLQTECAGAGENNLHACFPLSYVSRIERFRE